MPRTLHNALIAFLAAYLLLLPFNSSVALRNLALLGALVATLAWALRHPAQWRERVPPARVWIPIACWSAWCALSVAWSVEPALSATELRPELGTPLVAFFIFHAFTRDAATFDRWSWALAAGLALLALAAFGQKLAYGEWRPAQWHGDVGNYSTHAVVVLPILAWAWLRAEGARGRRAAIAATAAATLVVILWSENRMAWPALAGMAALAAGLAARSQAAEHRRKLAALTVLAIAASIALFFVAQQHRQQTLAARGQGVTADLATDPRLGIWHQAFRRIGEAPWLGRGFGRGTLRAPEGAPRDGIQDPSQWHAHNVFLNVMLSLGAVGLALFVWMWAAMAREMARAVSAPAPWRWAGVLGITLLAGFTLKNLTDDFFVRHVALLGWSLAGALTGLVREAPAARG